MFRDGVLKVFRSTLADGIRFHCKVDYESETYWSTGLPLPLFSLFVLTPTVQ